MYGKRKQNGRGQDMSETGYLVSQASKLLEVQSHVLRYWEEELLLPIGRNELGHRYYTRYDIQVILCIKELKKKGFPLKEIKKIIPMLYEAVKQEKQEKQNKNTKIQKANSFPNSKKRKKAQKIARTREQKKNQQENRTVPEEFMEILDRLVKERMREQNHRNQEEEEKCRKLDEKIRICQKARKEVAAAIEKEKQEKHRFFRKKE